MAAIPESVECIRAGLHGEEKLVPDSLQRLVDLTYLAAEAVAIKSGAPTGDRLDLPTFLGPAATLAVAVMGTEGAGV